MKLTKIEKLSDKQKQIYNDLVKKKIVSRRNNAQKLNYDEIVFGTDQDLDGFSIRGILLSLFTKFAPEQIKEGNVSQLRTPIIVLKQKGKIKHFFMTFDEYNSFLEKNDIKGYVIDYKKGLGSWEKEELEEIFLKNDMNMFFDTLEWNKELYNETDDWFSSEKSDIRKEKLSNNSFSILNA